MHGTSSGVHALALHLLQPFGSHLPGVFLVRLVLLIKAGHSGCQEQVNKVVSETLQSFWRCPALLGKLPVVVPTQQLPGNLSAPTCLQGSSGGVHSTRCLHTHSAWNLMQLSPAFVSSSHYCIQPLKVLSYFSPSSLPSLLSWHNTVSISSFNTKKLPSANDYPVALLVACTVSPLFLSPPVLLSVWLDSANQRGQPTL